MTEMFAVEVCVVLCASTCTMLCLQLLTDVDDWAEMSDDEKSGSDDEKETTKDSGTSSAHSSTRTPNNCSLLCWVHFQMTKKLLARKRKKADAR